MRVLHSSILHFLPILKYHHIVLISDNKCVLPNICNNNNNVYTVDFSPINQTESYTLRNLLFAYDVPAEIRIRRIPNIDFFSNDDMIIDSWSKMNNLTPIQSQELSDSVFYNIHENKDIKMFLSYIIRNWSHTMNLYSRNCQHFSGFCERIRMRT